MRPLPILIGGCPRSGTTLLVQILNTDSSYFISSEENLLNKYATIAKSFGTRERRAKVHESYGERDLSERETLDAKILAYNFTEQCTWHLIEEAYRWHHAALSPHKALTVWGDKLPNYYKSIPEVLALDREALYIHITRNPFDVVNSMIRRTEMAKQGRDWWRAITNFPDMVQAWSDAWTSVGRHEADPRVLHIQYEDLVFDFPAQIDRLRDFLRRPLEAANVTIADPAKHFDRRFLVPDHYEAILKHPDVRSYVERQAKSSSPWVARALKRDPNAVR